VLRDRALRGSATASWCNLCITCSTSALPAGHPAARSRSAPSILRAFILRGVTPAVLDPPSTCLPHKIEGLHQCTGVTAGVAEHAALTRPVRRKKAVSMDVDGCGDAFNLVPLTVAGCAWRGLDEGAAA